MSNLYFCGQIIESRSRFKNNNYDRPYLVVEYQEDKDELLVIPITGAYEERLPYFHVLVHASYNIHQISKLTKPCVAKCNEYEIIDVKTVVRRTGRLPDDILGTVLQAFDRFLDSLP